jgi:hypothetical protein
MQTITIEKDNAIKAYKEADDKGKTLLTNLLGKKHFLLKITDRIKSFEDACEELGLNPNDPMFTEGTPDVIAYNKLTKAIIPALNEQWTPDWTNTNQRKWYCWFKYESAGFRFFVAVCD